MITYSKVAHSIFVLFSLQLGFAGWDTVALARAGPASQLAAVEKYWYLLGFETRCIYRLVQEFLARQVDSGDEKGSDDDKEGSEDDLMDNETASD